MKDTTWFSQTVIEKLANLRQPEGAAHRTELSALTLREREVLELICGGAADGEDRGAAGAVAQYGAQPCGDFVRED